MTNIDWDNFITKNRSLIDEFLGSNNPTYTSIALKGKVAKEFDNKDRVFDYFEALMMSGLDMTEQNIYLRKLLNELRKNTEIIPNVPMKFGINSNILLGKDKQIFNSIMTGELNG